MWAPGLKGSPSSSTACTASGMRPTSRPDSHHPSRGAVFGRVTHVMRQHLCKLHQQKAAACGPRVPGAGPRWRWVSSRTRQATLGTAGLLAPPVWAPGSKMGVPPASSPEGGWPGGQEGAA